MKIFIIIFTIFFLNLYADDTITINDETKYLEVLPYSQIFIDDTKTLNLKDIKTKNFKNNDADYLSYGYSPPFAVWVKFTLKNDSHKPIYKILQYDHEITTNVTFFNGDKVFQDGILYPPKNKDTTNPLFSIELNPKEII